jgi:Ohr subfamily peroxiredoxin
MDRPTSILYRDSATATGGRDGRSMLSEGGLVLAMAIPKSMGGSGEGSNPEQLFALGYASCFSSALAFVARAKSVDVSKSRVTADVGIGRNAAGGFALAVELKVAMPGIEAAQAQQLVEAAHQVCPYSNATRGNIDVKLSLV